VIDKVIAVTITGIARQEAASTSYGVRERSNK